MESTDGHLTSLDLKDPIRFPDADFRSIINRWTFIKGDSRKVEVDGEFGLTMIDSGHTYELTTIELSKFAPRSKIILLHDTDMPDVSRAIEDYLSTTVGERWTYENHGWCNGLGIMRRE